MKDIHHPQLAQIARLIVPQATMIRAWPLTGGISAQMTALEIALPDNQRRRLVVRQPGEGTLRRSPHAAADEFRLLRVLREAGLAVPEPYLLDESGTILPAPFLVIEYIEGKVEFAPADVNEYARQMAAQLAAIHRVQADVSFLPGQGRALLHGDFWPGNLLWRDGRLIAVVDWEDAVLGEPLADVAISRLDTLFIFGREAMESFTQAYQTANPLDFGDLPLWDMRAAERAAPHLAEWAAGYPAWGRPDLTEQTFRTRHEWFVRTTQARLR